jgi:hypothetical protein
MKNFEESPFIQCPYCFSSIPVTMDYSGGTRQSFVLDCEICCRPILIKVTLRNGNILSLDAEKES